MKVLISSLDNAVLDLVIEVTGLSFDHPTGNFWMRYVMGDDWLQRVESSSALASTPRLVRFFEDAVFVVWENQHQALEFVKWLTYAQETVREGFRTMRG